MASRNSGTQGLSVCVCLTAGHELSQLPALPDPCPVPCVQLQVMNYPSSLPYLTPAQYPVEYTAMVVTQLSIQMQALAAVTSLWPVSGAQLNAASERCNAASGVIV